MLQCSLNTRLAMAVDMAKRMRTCTLLHAAQSSFKCASLECVGLLPRVVITDVIGEDAESSRAFQVCRQPAGYGSLRIQDGKVRVIN